MSTARPAPVKVAVADHSGQAALHDTSESVLVLNCGSSSIKFALFDADALPVTRRPVWAGKVDGIGTANPSLVEGTTAPAALALDSERPYHDALQAVRACAQRRAGGRLPAVVSHRVVHGGSKYSQPLVVDRNLLAELKGFIPLAPLHQPYALQAIEGLMAEVPGLPQVACFDTAFHRSLPLVEQMLPLPQAMWERGIRRYGFHGLSYEYMSIALAERHGIRAQGRTIVAHLGSGASLCAMHRLQSVATTMGFSALDGLMMGTRCGALDPGVLLHLMATEKLSVEQVTELLYHESGLLGVSGVSSSAKALLDAEAANPQARAALALYVRRIVREIGALAAVLGGINMLAFTGGVGEHSATLRRRICAALEWMGVQLDGDANRSDAPTISAPGSRVLVAVEPTNEEWIAASHAWNLLRGGVPVGQHSAVP